MEKVNVRFTLNSSSGKISFSALNEIENEEIAAALTDKLLSWEMRVKEAAINNMIKNEFGEEQAKSIKVKITKEN
ncbi:hypothetical protein AWH56_002060 [Anaerobacillus isosaccharinicus]|uniref:DUF2922 domain-containing protein n=1 Tax=Anaerobacillus isosaccharinicus TaxID=1532552 RepID=A0A1S2MG99_9BACI|nr:hypothetical protein [Anaerobacillus isosaccharinicus]MBA5585166.1 hypothetical protein [Anaerobacillus isosaccharinicus]QOY36497.1 hypothetical protein AWH56_002060 [Anaerobacillus isosaccharinicus]